MTDDTGLDLWRLHRPSCITMFREYRIAVTVVSSCSHHIVNRLKEELAQTGYRIHGLDTWLRLAHSFTARTLYDSKLSLACQPVKMVRSDSSCRILVNLRPLKDGA